MNRPVVVAIQGGPHHGARLTLSTPLDVILLVDEPRLVVGEYAEALVTRHVVFWHDWIGWVGVPAGASYPLSG